MAENDSTQQIFSEVSYFLASDCSDEVAQYLKLGGATKEFYISDLVTHVLSDTCEFALAGEAKEYNLPVVTENWVKMSIKVNKKLPTQPFSPKLIQLFSDIRVCPSKIPCGDLSKLWAMITFHGGKCQLNLTPSCTHLVVPQATGEKYKVVSKLEGKIKIVTPSWIIDCIKENKLINEELYAPQEEKEHIKETLESDEKVEEKPVVMEISTPTDTLKTPENFKQHLAVAMPTMETEEPDEESDVKEILEVRETPVKTEGEATDAEPLENVTATRHEECHDRYDENVAERAKMVEVDGKSDEDRAVSKTSELEQDDHEEKHQQSSILAGCVFVVSDYQDCMDHSILTTWIEVITTNGGEFQPFYSHRCTHLLCLNQSGKVFCQAMHDGKKVITAHWLNDVLTEKKMLVPSRPLHLPVPFPYKIPQCKTMTITVTGYTGVERFLVKNMIYIIGATYTGYLTRSNTQMICKFADGTKYIKAKEWGIPCVNAKWLGDILSSARIFPCALKKYSVFGKADDLIFDEEIVKTLLVPWKDNITAAKNDALSSQDLNEKKRKQEEELQDADIQIQTKRQRLSNSATIEVNCNTPHVLFTGLTIGKSASLIKMLSELGGVAASSPRTCTHLVATKIVRTAKFLSAISVCQFIVTPDWLEKSYEAKKLIDPKLFSLKDLETEKEYKMDLLTSIERAQSRPLLDGIKVYATQNVQPTPSSLKEIVEAAGGQFVTDILSKTMLASLKILKTKEGNPAFIVITSQDDLKLCNPFIKSGIDIHSTEIILAGVLTQKLDYETFKVKFM